MVSLNKLVKELKERIVPVFEKHWDSRLFRIDCNLLDQICENCGRLGIVTFIVALRMNILSIFKRVYQRTSIEKESEILETSCAMKSIVK